MGLRTGIYAKVWSVRTNEKGFCSGQVNVSMKDKDNPNGNSYKTMFQGYVQFAKAAKDKAMSLGLPEISSKDNPVYRSIKITSSPDIGYYFNFEKYKRLIEAAKQTGNNELINFVKQNGVQHPITLWDFEIADGDSGASASASTPTKTKKTTTKKKAEEPPTATLSDDDLPF